MNMVRLHWFCVHILYVAFKNKKSIQSEIDLVMVE